MNASADCPRCNRPLVYADELLKGCEGGCSRYLIEEALNGRGPVPGAEYSNGADPVADIDRIDGAELLDSIAGFITRFQVLPSQEVEDLLALWVLHTHAFEAAWATPYLRITSAAPESGKTQLLEILATLVRRGVARRQPEHGRPVPQDRPPDADAAARRDGQLPGGRAA
jgi:hypothetical protein